MPNNKIPENEKPLKGAKAIGKEIGEDDPRKVYYLLESGHLNAAVVKVGRQWWGYPTLLKRVFMPASAE